MSTPKETTMDKAILKPRPTKTRVTTWGDPFSPQSSIRFGVEAFVHGRWMNVCEAGDPVFRFTREAAKAYADAMMEQSND